MDTHRRRLLLLAALSTTALAMPGLLRAAVGVAEGEFVAGAVGDSMSLPTSRVNSRCFSPRVIGRPFHQACRIFCRAFL